MMVGTGIARIELDHAIVGRNGSVNVAIVLRSPARGIQFFCL